LICQFPAFYYTGFVSSQIDTDCCFAIELFAAMDLNASPQPEEDDEPFKRRHEDRMESAVEIARRVQ